MLGLFGLTDKSASLIFNPPKCYKKILRVHTKESV
jgi:hypothetical protein